MLARIGANAETHARVAIRAAGPDRAFGTADDQGRLAPGDMGQGELVIEGKREGLHTLDIELTAILDGFAHGEVPIHGHAAGSVLVRNPKFSIAFAHPRTIRTGEPYLASMTVMNTSETPAELVSVRVTVAVITSSALGSVRRLLGVVGSIRASDANRCDSSARSARSPNA